MIHSDVSVQFVRCSPSQNMSFAFAAECGCDAACLFFLQYFKAKGTVDKNKNIWQHVSRRSLDIAKDHVEPIYDMPCTNGSAGFHHIVKCCMQNFCINDDASRIISHTYQPCYTECC